MCTRVVEDESDTINHVVEPFPPPHQKWQPLPPTLARVLRGVRFVSPALKPC